LHFRQNGKRHFRFNPVGVRIRIPDPQHLAPFGEEISLYYCRCAQASTKNAVSDTEKREKKMLEKKLTEMEEELKVTTTSLSFSFPHRRQCKMSLLKKNYL
jgi:hypothetical protein